MVRTSQRRASAPTPQMGPFRQPINRVLQDLPSPRLPKRVQMQGGARRAERGVLRVRRSECTSTPTPQMGPFRQPARRPSSAAWARPNPPSHASSEGITGVTRSPRWRRLPAHSAAASASSLSLLAYQSLLQNVGGFGRQNEGKVHQPLVVPPPRRGYGKLFLEHVVQAPQGCDFDFLRPAP